MFDVIIIGAGPAGLMAGIAATGLGKKTVIFEQMAAAGRKLLITGKGRCNLTNSCEIAELIKNIPGNGKFLYSAFEAFDNQKLRDFFHTNGLETKVERGGRVFPVSDKAEDVRKVLLQVYFAQGGSLRLTQKVSKLLKGAEKIQEVKLQEGLKVQAKSVILAAGGASYPKTGSDGSGFKLAEQVGHTIITPKPSLVPLEVDSPYLQDLQGLSLKNVTASIICEQKVVAKEFGEMLFTHFGLSGPIILSLSNLVAQNLAQGKKVEISLDLKPALPEEKLANRLQRDLEKFSRKQIKNSLAELLPSSLIPVVITEGQLSGEKFTNQLTKIERRSLLKVLKDLRFQVRATRPLTEAIVTAGGVSTKEINPKTMQSKLWENLYFAGEVIDIDGYTGGFNLQAAFSTGYVAGVNA